MKQMSRSVPAVIFLMLIFTASVHAADLAQPGTPARKLQRGFLNIALSPFELSNQFSKERKTDKFPPSWMSAIGRGGLYMVGRMVVGVEEILTFPISAPANYGPILQPEFPWENSPELTEVKSSKS